MPEGDRDRFFDSFFDDLFRGRDFSNPGGFFDDIAGSGPRRDPGAGGRGGGGGGAPIDDGGAPVPPAAAPEAGGGRSIFDYYNPPNMGGGFGGGGGGGTGPMPGANFDIAGKMMANEGQLRGLDPATEAELAKVKEAELMMLQKTMGEQSASMMENLFGRGVARSTIAGRVGEQMVASQGLAAAQIESQAAQRKISLRQDISDRAIKEASVASQELDSQRGYSVGMAGVAAENNRTAASLKISSMETAARMAIAQGQLGLGYAELDLDKDRFGFDQTKFWEELQRNDRQLDIMEMDAKNGKRNGILGMLGGIGAGLLEMIPFLSHPAFKNEMQELGSENTRLILDILSKISLYDFKYNGSDEPMVGPNAIELMHLDERLSNGVTVNPYNMIFMLVGAVQSLAAQVEELKNGN